jgi:hypothetical protein
MMSYPRPMFMLYLLRVHLMIIRATVHYLPTRTHRIEFEPLGKPMT